MSTKRLDKAIIQGGRSSRSKWLRYHSHKSHRMQEKQYLHHVTRDPDSFDVKNIKQIKKVYPEFNDKLGPVYKWLHSQVGRVWDEVYSEIRNKFDTRTTPGRHIVFDHLLANIEEDPYNPSRFHHLLLDDPTTSHWKNEFYLDEQRILRSKKFIPRQNYGFYVQSIDTKNLIKWLSNKIVGRVGNKLFWYTINNKNYKLTWGSQLQKYWGERHQGLIWLSLQEEPIYQLNSLGLKKLDQLGKPIIIGTQESWLPAGTPKLKRSQPLSKAEEQFFNQLPKFYQDKILAWAPTN